MPNHRLALINPAHSAGRTHAQAVWRARGRFWLLACLLLATPACNLIPRKPVADNVVAARQLTLRGIDAVEHERWEEAELLFSQAIRQCPVDERAHWRYAEVLWRRGALPQAVAHMEQAVNLSGGDPERMVQLGEMELALGNVDSAARRAERAIAVQGKLASAWALRGDVLQSTGRTSEALSAYHRALRYQVHYPKVQLAVARIYRDEQRPLRALATLDALSNQYAPGETPSEVLALQGLTYKAFGRYDDAVQHFQQALARGPATVDLLYQLSESYLAAGDPASAQLTVLQALELAPGHSGCRQLQTQIASRQHQMAASLER